MRATSIAIEVPRDSGDDSPWVHYGTYEFQALYEPVLSEQVAISQVSVFPFPRSDIYNVIDGNYSTSSRLVQNQEPLRTIIPRFVVIPKPLLFNPKNPGNITGDELNFLGALTNTDIQSFGSNVKGQVIANSLVQIDYEQSLLTPPNHQTDEITFVINFPKLEKVSRLRIHKNADGDLDGQPDRLDLRVFYSNVPHPPGIIIPDSFLSPVRGMRSGYQGLEKVNASRVGEHGEVIGEIHDSMQEGAYSLTFSPVDTQALILKIRRQPGDKNSWVYFNLNEIQAFSHSAEVISHAIQSVQVFDAETKVLNNRGDQNNAIDNSLTTIGHLTPPFTTKPHIVAYDFGVQKKVNRIRVAKVADTQGGGGGGPEKMDLEILYTTDTGSLNTRNYRRVTGLQSGDLGKERIKADKVFLDGIIDNDIHDFGADGFYSLSFNEVEASAVAIRFALDPSHENRAVHYGTYDFEAFWTPQGGEYIPTSRPVTFRVSNRQINNRGDEHLAVDGDTNTSSYLTPPGTEGAHIVAFDFNGQLRNFNRLRIAKDANTSGEGGDDSMDLKVLFTTDSGPLENRTYHAVSQMISGFQVSEKINAGRVSPDGTIEDDRHDYHDDGFYSLSFPTIQATAVAIQFTRDAKDPTPFNHYLMREIQVLREEDQIDQLNITSNSVFHSETKIVSERPDNQKSIDGALNTFSLLTAPGTKGPHQVVFNLSTGGDFINRIRVAKAGDSDGDSNIEKMNLEILCTTEPGPLQNRNYLPVSNLRNGYFGIEEIVATKVHSNGKIEGDQHDFGRDGFYSLTFDKVKATAIAIKFQSEDSRADTQYQVFEF